MATYARRSYVPTFSLHGAAYDPPAPVPFSAPLVAPTAADGAAPNPNPSLHPSSSTNGSGNGRSVRSSRVIAQAELAETVSIMRDNIQSLTERGERLEALESRTENLVIAARSFRKTSHKVRKDMWWKDMKMRLIIAVALSVIVGLTILSIVQAVRRSKMQQSQTAQMFLQKPLSEAPQVTSTSLASLSPSLSPSPTPPVP